MDDPWAPSTFDLLTDQDIAYVCSTCDSLRVGDIVGRVNEKGDDVDWNPDKVRALVRCRSCGTGALFAYEYTVGEWGQAKLLWPQDRPALSYYIPGSLRREYHEAQQCFSAKAYTAATVMVRRTLEGVCTEQGVKTKTLVGGLKELENQGKLDGRLVQWADALRVLGNQAAHFTGDSVSAEDAADAMDFAQALLDYLYVLTRRFDAFQARRNQKN